MTSYHQDERVVYKLTTRDFKTRKGMYNECTWGPNVTHTASGEGGLCGPGWLHAYTHPLLAVLLNPIHAEIPNPVLWEARGRGDYRSDRGLKVGFTSLTTVRILDRPVVTTKQRVAFAKLCADAARAAADVTCGARASARAAADAADSAGNFSTYAAARAAASAAVFAAGAAYAAGTSIDFIDLANRAMES